MVLLSAFHLNILNHRESTMGVAITCIVQLIKSTWRVTSPNRKNSMRMEDKVDMILFIVNIRSIKLTYKARTRMGMGMGVLCWLMELWMSVKCLLRGSRSIINTMDWLIALNQKRMGRMMKWWSRTNGMKLWGTNKKSMKKLREDKKKNNKKRSISSGSHSTNSWKTREKDLCKN